jgi:hypothetical protein
MSGRLGQRLRRDHGGHPRLAVDHVRGLGQRPDQRLVQTRLAVLLPARALPPDRLHQERHGGPAIGRDGYASRADHDPPVVGFTDQPDQRHGEQRFGTRPPPHLPVVRGTDVGFAGDDRVQAVPLLSRLTGEQQGQRRGRHGWILMRTPAGSGSFCRAGGRGPVRRVPDRAYRDRVRRIACAATTVTARSTRPPLPRTTRTR